MSKWWGMRLGHEARLSLVGLCKPWGGLGLYLESENLGSPFKKGHHHIDSLEIFVFFLSSLWVLV